MEFRSKVKQKVLTGQSREIISALLKFMKKEADLGAPLIPFQKIQKRVALATGVSVRTIKRIKDESKKIEKGEMASFSTPNKRRYKTSKVSLDDFDQNELRKTITHFHIAKKTIPSITKVHEKFCKDFAYQGSRETLRKAVYNLGFNCVKVKNSRRILMERHEIRHKRIEFLRKMHAYRKEGRPIIYMDESNTRSPHIHRNDEGTAGIRKPMSKGNCRIIINTGSKDGIRQNVYVKWKSNSGIDDFHTEINFENYQKWIAEKLIPDLPERSVVVINNNPYHDKLVDKLPTSSSNKNDMQKWLRERSIQFDENMLKPELYELIKIHKPEYKQYKIDEIFTANGHDVLRLPPYHPDLNPIELVWTEMKDYVAKQNVQFSFQNVADYCDSFFEQFSAEDWKARCAQAETSEKKFMRQELMIDRIVDDFITGMIEDDDSDIYTESEGELSLNYDMMECEQSD